MVAGSPKPFNRSHRLLWIGIVRVAFMVLVSGLSRAAMPSLSTIHHHTTTHIGSQSWVTTSERRCIAAVWRRFWLSRNIAIQIIHDPARFQEFLPAADFGQDPALTICVSFAIIFLVPGRRESML